MAKVSLDQIKLWIAWHCPRWLAYWCTVVVGAWATTGENSDQITPSLTVLDALIAWKKRP